MRTNVKNKLKPNAAVRCSLPRFICYNGYWSNCQFGVYLQISSNTLQPATLETLSSQNLRVLFIINKYIKIT